MARISQPLAEMTQPSRVPLTDITSAIAVSPVQAAAIVWQVAARLERWIKVKQTPEVVVPALEDIALNRGGTVWWHRGRMLPSDRAVGALGALLDALLHPGPRERAPAGLVYVLARATDERHLAPFERLEEFRAAIGRHAGRAPAATVDGLLAQFFMRRAGLPPLDDRSTIADVRRLRRAGGVTLPTIAAETGIPISLLRELEWGVYANWTVAHARPSVEAYAARAGLDPAAVTTIVRREQEEAVGLMPVRPRGAWPDGRRAVDRTLPYALAAVVAIVIALAAPRSAPQARAVAAAVATRTTGLEPASAVTANEIVTLTGARPSTSAPAAPERLWRARPRAPAKPARAARRRTQTTAGHAASRPDPSSKSAPHSLLRFMRTIAGDGRYKVQPFPKP